MNDTAYQAYASDGMRFMVTYVYRHGPQTIAHLANIYGVSRQHMERILNECRCQRWVELKPNPKRKRSQCIHLTERGECVAVMLLHEAGILLESLAKVSKVEPMLDQNYLEKSILIMDRLSHVIESGEWDHELIQVRADFLEEARRH